MADKPTANESNARKATPAKRKRAAPGQGQRAIEARRKQHLALDLRMKGYTFEQIAQQVGYANRGNAHKVVTEALDGLRREKAEQVMELELGRLDQLTVAHFEAALAGDPEATKLVLQIMARRAKYLNLDNPKLTDAVAEGTTLLAAMTAQLHGMPDTYEPVEDD